jgi:hypothetical protein
MIIPFLAKLYGIILENNISIWIERHRERANTRFRSYHSTAENLITVRIIAV